MKFATKLVLSLLLICCPATVFAELPDAVLNDFAVVNGVVVTHINGEYIVDLDNQDNLHVGDILTLVKKGKPIMNPVSKEIIGSIDEVRGFLQVSRVLSGYSYAKVISEGLQPEDGALVKRFEQVPARLIVNGEGSEELAREIKTELPQFQWDAAGEGEQALLTFTLGAGSLDVVTFDGHPLHNYVVSEDKRLKLPVTSTSRPMVAPQAKENVKPLQRLANSLVTALGGTTNEERFAEMDEAIIRQRQEQRQGVWMGPNLAGHPTGLAVADLDGDGQQEIAIALEEKILIARVSNGEFTQLAEVKIPAVLQMLSIDALDLNQDGRSELYLTALAGTRPSSFVVQYDGGSYGIAINSVRWLLRAVNLPGEDAKTLVGQKLGSVSGVFSGAVFRVERQGDELVEGAALNLPEQLNLFNFVTFTNEKNQQVFLYMTSGDYLKVISSEGLELWESSDYFGGSENCFMPKTEMRDEVDPLICVRPRMIKRAGNEILVVQNEGQRMVQRYRSFDRGRLVSLSWNGFSMLENWHTASQPGYLGDFALADADNDGKDELVMAVKFKHGGLTNKARSSIVIYELN